MADKPKKINTPIKNHQIQTVVLSEIVPTVNALVAQVRLLEHEVEALSRFVGELQSERTEKDELAGFTKEKLKGMAKILEIENYSTFDKEQLVEAVGAEIFGDEDEDEEEEE